MKILIHIGWHKTGTTSIQEFLLKNKERLVIGNKIYYPEEGMLYSAHHNLAWTVQNKKKSPWGDVPSIEGGAESYISQAVDKAKSMCCDTIIFSSEEFCTFNLQEIILLHSMMTGHVDEVKIISYIRRQDLIIESGYNMEVKWWGVRYTKTFDDYIEGKKGYPNYYETLSNWAEVFGSNSLIVRPFDRALFERNDVRVDFSKLAGMNVGRLVFSTENFNDSLGPKTVEFLRMINSLDISSEDHEKFSDKLLAYDKERDAPSCIFFEPEMRVRFMQLCTEANKKLFTLLGYELSSLQLDYDQLPKRNVNNLNLEEFLELVEIAQIHSNFLPMERTDS